MCVLGVWGFQGGSQAPLAWKLLNLGFTVLHNDPGSLLKIHAPGLHLSKILIQWFWSWAQDPVRFSKLPNDSPLNPVDSDWAESIFLQFKSDAFIEESYASSNREISDFYIVC